MKALSSGPVLLRLLRGLATGAIVIAGVSCGGEPRAEVPRIVRDTLGDTVRVTSRAPAESTLVADSLEILWRSPELEAPVGMARLSDGLVVLDRRRLHLLGPGGEHRRSIGREGEGPGEFAAPRAVGVRGDTVFVVDSRASRLSLFGPDGAFLHSRSQLVIPGDPIPLGPSRSEAALGFAGRGVLFHLEEMGVTRAKALERGIAWSALDSDSVRVVLTMDDVWFRSVGGVLADPDPYGPRARLAVGRDGRYATADGQEYCVHVKVFDEPGVLTVCRDWERVPVTDAARSPDLSLLPEDRRESLRAVLEAAEPGSHLPSFADLAFDDVGRLWVQVMDERYRDVWPVMRVWVPELRPDRVPWDVFSADGELLRRVEVPRELAVHVFGEESVVGFLELPTGELVVARAGLRPVG